jgi:hypothetical protein
MRFTRLLSFFGCLLLVSGAAHAAFIYEGVMTGANEVPANGSAATGFTSVLIDDNLMTVHVDWSGLTGGLAAAAHIHCCTPLGSNVGVAVGFAGFPAAASGVFEKSFDLLDAAIYTSGFLNGFGGGTAAGARAALLAGLDAGTAYSNIHNAQFPGGEIRATLRKVDEPAVAWLLMAGCGAFVVMRRRTRSA